MSQLPVPGLTFIPDFLTPDEEMAIIQELDSCSWSTALARRTQHYGYEYNYKSKNAQTLAPPLTGRILGIAERLRDQGLMDMPTQCIVNEYTREQGISAHTDSAIFGPVIISISLGAPTVMIFSNGDQKVPVFLPRRSLIVLRDDARNVWKHEIPQRKTLDIPGQRRVTKDVDYRRVSLTYRTMRR